MPKTASRAEMTQATHPDVIRLGRLERGMSQRDLADALRRKYKIKVESSQISRIERMQTTRPGKPLARALCKFFDLPITFFEPDPPH
jgi:transcriptional regulator with XRE-family HTH domain